MKCEVVQVELSARMDGAHDPRLDDALDTHVDGCVTCRSFAARAETLRQSVRLEPAEPVRTSLVDAIMRDVTERRRSTPRAWVRPVATFLAAAAASALVLGGLGALRRGVPPALAKEVPHLVAEASKDLVDPYRLEYLVTDRATANDDPTRTTIEVWGPETMRVRTHEGSLVVDGDTWRVDGPKPRTVTGREPFDGDLSMPSDIVVPAQILAGNERAEVIGRDEVIGREVIGVRLPARDASPLFAYLGLIGERRDFFPLDPVTVWLDDETFVPLRYEVRSADSTQRRLWSSRNAEPAMEPNALLFRASATSFEEMETQRPVIDTDGAIDRGFEDADDEAIAGRLGFRPLRPTTLNGLVPHATGITASLPDEAITSYAKGLAWLKIRETRTWDQPTLFGDVSSLALWTDLPTGGAYIEPATANAGRRVAIHAADTDLQLESNLPTDELLEVAASIPVRGIEAPVAWTKREWSGGIVREQLTPAEVASSSEPYIVVPGDSLPTEYELVQGHLVTIGTSRGLTLFYARRGIEPDGVGLRLHLQPRGTLPPPLEPDTIAVDVAGTTGRYSPVRGELEWVVDSVYRSITTQAFDLEDTIAIASSLRGPR